MTREEAITLLRKEVGEAKTAREVELATTAYLQRLALVERTTTNQKEEGHGNS